MKSLRVLWVEDDADIRGFVQKMCGPKFGALEIASSVVEAEKIYADMEAKGESPDLLVLDIAMPVEIGTTYARRLRAAGNDVSVLFVSGNDNALNRMEADALGSVGFVTKPFVWDDIFQAVRQLKPGVKG